MSAPRFSPEIKAKILEDYMLGECIAVIAKRYGCDQSYPAILAKRRGLFRDRRFHDLQRCGNKNRAGKKARRNLANLPFGETV